MARRYLAHYFDPIMIGAEIAQARDAADRLVRTPFARHRITVLADALLECGVRNGSEILELSRQ